jgi:hypothetical protein
MLGPASENNKFRIEEISMKIGRTFVVLALAAMALTAVAISQVPPKVTLPLNLVRGVTGPVVASTRWNGYSALNLIPGGGVIPITSTTAAFYLGFTAGTTADINNMVLYTTARNSPVITAVTPVALGGISNPSINLASPSVCKVAPSTTTPCIVRLDVLTLTLSAANDYYLVVYFTNDGNNSSLAATTPGVNVSSLFGSFISADESRLTVGQSLPSGSDGAAPYFLMYVMNN